MPTEPTLREDLRPDSSQGVLPRPAPTDPAPAEPAPEPAPGEPTPTDPAGPPAPEPPRQPATPPAVVQPPTRTDRDDEAPAAPGVEVRAGGATPPATPSPGATPDAPPLDAASVAGAPPEGDVAATAPPAAVPGLAEEAIRGAFRTAEVLRGRVDGALGDASSQLRDQVGSVTQGLVDPPLDPATRDLGVPAGMLALLGAYLAATRWLDRGGLPMTVADGQEDDDQLVL